MIPRLYEKTVTTFTGFGICPLVDAIDATVDWERNGAYTLDMTYPRYGRWADELRVDRIILADPYDGAPEAEPFRIASLEFDLNGDIEVHAEHVFYQLNHVLVSPFSGYTRYPNKVWESACNGLLTPNPFTFQTDLTDENATVFQYGSDKAVPLRKVLWGMEKSIADLYGGDFEFNRFAVKHHTSWGADNGVKIAYTKNLTGLEYSVDMSNVYTGAVAYWASEGIYVESALQTIANDWSFDRTIVLDASAEFENQPGVDLVANLNAYALSYLQSNANGPKVSVQIEFVPLWQTEEYKDFYDLEHVAPCDIVTAIYPQLNLSVQAKVVKTSYDVLRDRYKDITISTVRQTLADTIFSLMKE